MLIFQHFIAEREVFSKSQTNCEWEIFCPETKGSIILLKFREIS